MAFWPVGRKEDVTVPARAKPLAKQSKHLTKAEQQARNQAEAAVMPVRPQLALKPPAYVKTDAKAKRYWLEIVKRMEGVSILDALDGEVLAVYCTMLSRRDATHQLFTKLLKDSNAKNADPEDQAAILGKMDALMTKLQGQERSILQYADKLGLTPSGRAHLARKRAAQAAGEVGDDDDLFGD